MDVKSRARATIGATIIFAVVATLTMISGASPASATPTHLNLGVIRIGNDIVVEYSGSPVLLTSSVHTLNWVITGGTEPIPTADVLFDIDLVSLTHITISNVEVLLLNTGGCVVTFDGPLLIDAVSSGIYHAFFTKAQLGGISYSPECGAFLEGLVLSTIAANGVLILFHLS